MPTPVDHVATHAEAAARVAALVRALPDSAICALVDAMAWAVQEGHDADIVQTLEDGLCIAGLLEQTV